MESKCALEMVGIFMKFGNRSSEVFVVGCLFLGLECLFLLLGVFLAYFLNETLLLLSYCCGKHFLML